MKIKSIAAICKKCKQVVLFSKRNAQGDIVQQYISNGSAVYPIFGFPVEVLGSESEATQE